MKHRPFLLILSISALGLGYFPMPTSAQMPSPKVEGFLHCVGLKSMNMADVQNNTENIQAVFEEILNIYSFLRSHIGHDRIEELLQSALDSNSNQSLDFTKMWFQVNLRPILSRVSKESLTCLSMGNITCQTYQIIVKEISTHFSSLNPGSQKRIYKYFMYHFLARNSSAGCISPGEGSDVWLMKNFGAFSKLARFSHFAALNMDFDGLKVLRLLTPEQKAELLLHPEMGHLDNSTFSMVFQSLLQPFLNKTQPPTSHASAAGSLPKILKPLGAFISHLVSYARMSNMTEMRSHRLIQSLLNYTLAELAKAQEGEATPTAPPIPDNFNISSMEDWFQHIVVPLIQPFLPQNKTIPPGLKVAFFKAFKSDEEPSGPSDMEEHADACDMVDVHPCALANSVETLHKVFMCADMVNLTASHLSSVANESIKILAPLFEQHCSMNTSSMGPSPCKSSDISRFPPESFQDVNMIRVVFQNGIRPELSTLSGSFLTCLSSRNFSCQSFQALVMELSKHMQYLDGHRRMLVYTHFIHPFLSERTSEDPSCISHTNSSKDWVMRNFGGFSMFASLQNFTSLNANFSALEARELLSPQQAVELLQMPHADEDTISAVFDHFLTSANDRRGEFLYRLMMLLHSNMLPPMNCSTIRIIMKKLHHTLSAMPGRLEPAFWFSINMLMQAQPMDCRMMMPVNETCPFTQYNETSICSEVNRDDLMFYLESGMTEKLCDFTIPQYACSDYLYSFTAQNISDLLTCKLKKEEMTYPKETWKLFLTKASGILDEALSILTNESVMLRSPEVLEVVSELRIDTLTEEQLQSDEVIHHLFHPRLRTLMSSVSPEFLSCLSSKNFTCSSYHHVMNEFGYQFPHMDEMQQRMVLQHLILPFLMRNHTSDPACVDSVNGSEAWLSKNFKQYSDFVPLQQLLMLNPDFEPVEVLSALSPRQLAELLVSPDPALSDKKSITKAVFNHFMDSPDDMKMEAFLKELVMLSPEANLSCDAYKTILSKIDQAMLSGSGAAKSKQMELRSKLEQTALLHCPVTDIVSGCPTTPVNESGICDGANKVENTGMLCENSLRDYACMPMPTNLTSEQVAMIMSCNLKGNMTHSKETWKLLFTKVSGVLHEAFIIFANMSHNLTRPSAVMVLDVIGENLDAGITESSEDLTLITKIFQQKLKPFITFFSQSLLSCLSTKNFSCETYQVIVGSLSEKYEEMDEDQQALTYSRFMKVFMSRTDTKDPGCVKSTNGTELWLQKNFGKFSSFLNFDEFHRLNKNFSVVEALPHLTVKQLAEVAAAPGQLKTKKDVSRLMSHVPDHRLNMFYDEFSPVIKDKPMPAEVRSEILQQALDRANLTDPMVPDEEALVWLEKRLNPLVSDMREEQVAPFFAVVRHRECNISRKPVELLSAVRSKLPNDTEHEVQRVIMMSFREPMALRCYMNQSFYQFVKENYQEFPHPELPTILSLTPQHRQEELLNSIPQNDMGKLLRKAKFIDNSTELCPLLQTYRQTPSLLEKESFSEHTRSQIFPCVWPLALSEHNESEVDRWFDTRLSNYIKFLNKDLIGSNYTLNTSCVAFRKLVRIFGRDDFKGKDFKKKDFYDTIKNYLSTDGSPKCYDPKDPTLNSKAWFSQYISYFIVFAEADDFRTFGKEEKLQAFAVDPQNIALFSHPNISADVTSQYTEFIYQENPQFNLTTLPPVFRCYAPGDAFSQLDENQTLVVLRNQKTICSDVEPQISASLAKNIKTLTPDAFAALGNEVTILSPARFSKAPPGLIKKSLKQLGKVPNWPKAQSITIVKVLLAEKYKVDNAQNLVDLGSLVTGLPTDAISSIPPSVALESAASQEFVANMQSAPPIVQEKFVQQIIEVNSEPQQLLSNVPDEMAKDIPLNLLIFEPPVNPEIVEKLKKKKWKPEQAALFFDSVAEGTDDADELPNEMLQGFSCTRAQKLKKSKVKNVIKACRRRPNRRKVNLKESQLTCMHNHIKSEKPQNFQDFPSEMLLYIDYKDVEPTGCKSYFKEVGHADFDVLSEALTEKKEELLRNAKSCLGIKGTNLNTEQVEILGNMACTLDEDDITNADPMIVEKLKNCQTLSDGHIKAIETVLLRGDTQYGEHKKWNSKTLDKLGPLPLHLGNNFWKCFSKRDKRNYLRKLRKQKRKCKCKCQCYGKLFKELRGPGSIARRAAECTAGNITQATISDGAFPSGYDATQFDNCLSVQVAKENVAALAEKLDEIEFRKIAMDKLKQAYPSDLPEEVVGQLGQLSRVASVGDIKKWNITTIDTLAALMNSEDGEWEPAQSKAIIDEYLKASNNTLGTSELNAIGGTNLCSLPTSTLKDIMPDSLKQANSMDISACSEGQKKQLFRIAEQAFNESDPISLETYQLIQPYLGGASKEYIERLTNANVSMDLDTFRNLNQGVIQSLNVMEVKGLLGANVDSLKTYENDSTVQAWIRSQPQSELDSLGLGLVGGQVNVTVTTTPAMTTSGRANDTVTTIPHPMNSTAANSTSASATAANATAAMTTSGVDGTHTAPAHYLSLFFGLLFVVLQLL